MVRLFLSILGLAALLSGPVSAAGVTVTLACFSSPGFADACRSGAEEWERRTGNKVRLYYQPEDTTAVLQMNQRMLRARASDVDVFQVDIVWPGLLGEHFIDLRPHVDAATLDAHFPQILAANMVDGKLVAMPWFTDAGLLFYRRDLLEKHGQPVPKSWAELERGVRAVLAAERAAGEKEMVGFLWQGRPYEGLTCNVLEWIDSFGGGTIVEADGTVSVNNPRAVEALRTAARWLGPVTPWSVLRYAEDESRDAFRRGHAVFLRSWPFTWREVNAPDSPVAGKVGVAALPGGGEGGKPTGTLGGWNLAVSAYSKNKEAGIDLVRFLTGREEQRRRALLWSFSPTIADLYQDPEVLTVNPFLAEQHRTLVNAVARPSRVTGRQYDAVSEAVWTVVHTTLSGRRDAAAALAELDETLRRIGREGWLARAGGTE